MQRTPYLFTAKELDEETGLYYFGARYYDPRTSVWQSADPVLEKYLPSGDQEKDSRLLGRGGVFNSFNLGLYTYGHQNPIKLVDPDGNAVFENAQKLMEAGNAVLSDPSVQPGANGCATWCNRGVGLIEGRGGNATSYGNGQPGQYQRANEMIATLKDKNVATTVSAEQAVGYAKQGATVIAGAETTSGSGHVAIVAPVDMKPSGSLGRDVPSVFNVGKAGSTGMNLVSKAFPKDNQPNYYIRNDDLKTLSQRDSLTGKITSFLRDVFGSKSE